MFSYCRYSMHRSSTSLLSLVLYRTRKLGRGLRSRASFLVLRTQKLGSRGRKRQGNRSSSLAAWMPRQGPPLPLLRFAP